MTKLKIYSEEDFIDNEAIASATEKVLHQRIKIYVDLSFVSEEEIREINNTNRKVDAVTDVLSFPMLDGIRGKVLKKKDFALDFDESEKALFLGSIAICKKRAEEQALEYGHSVRREMCYLTVHGLLHLFGYDHMTEEDKAEMRAKEEEILALIGAER